MTRIRLYGLRVDLPSAMPGTTAIAADGPADLVVRFEAAPAAAANEAYRSPAAAGAVPTLVAGRLADGGLRLTYAEGARFTVAGDGRTVWGDWDAPLTEADAYTFLAGPVFGVALRAHGALALHASAVVVDGGTLAILGQSGAGKSTLAAACVREGLTLMSEDLLAVRRARHEWIASPGHHQVRLWDTGAATGPGAGVALPPLTRAWPKLGLDLGAHGLPFATDDAPLRGVVVLVARVARGAEPVVRTLTPAELTVELVAHSYANHLLDERVLGRELPLFGELARTVPGWSVAAAPGDAGLRDSVALLRRLGAADQ